MFFLTFIIYLYTSSDIIISLIITHMIHEIAQVLVETGRKIQTANERPADPDYKAKLKRIEDEMKAKIEFIIHKQK